MATGLLLDSLSHYLRATSNLSIHFTFDGSTILSGKPILPEVACVGRDKLDHESAPRVPSSLSWPLHHDLCSGDSRSVFLTH